VDRFLGIIIPVYFNTLDRRVIKLPNIVILIVNSDGSY